MEGGKIIDFGKRKREESNRGKRERLEITPDGDVLYPERKTDMTEAEALATAREIIAAFPDEAALAADFESRQKAGPDAGSAHVEIGDSAAHRSLENQRVFAAACTTENLVGILERHRRDPSHYYGTLIFAVAQETIKRFTTVPAAGE